MTPVQLTPSILNCIHYIIGSGQRQVIPGWIRSRLQHLQLSQGGQCIWGGIISLKWPPDCQTAHVYAGLKTDKEPWSQSCQHNWIKEDNRVEKKKKNLLFAERQSENDMLFRTVCEVSGVFLHFKLPVLNKVLLFSRSVSRGWTHLNIVNKAMGTNQR